LREMRNLQTREKVHEMYRARLLVVDRYDLMRIGLKIVLGRDASLEVVGEAKDGKEAIAHSGAAKSALNPGTDLIHPSA
jgi:hypothetical protein